MRINKLLAGVFLTFFFSASLGLSAWTLTTVIDLKVQVAEIKTQMTANAKNSNRKDTMKKIHALALTLAAAIFGIMAVNVISQPSINTPRVSYQTELWVVPQGDNSTNVAAF